MTMKTGESSRDSGPYLVPVKFISRAARRAFCIICCAVLLLSAAVPVCAAEHEDKIVRVGWFISDSFQEGGEGERKSGFAYDYLRKIADYTSWDYEYVYGDWPELYDMLCSGEIDVMGAISVTDERRGLMLFPNSAMGTDRYYLFKRTGNDAIDYDDLASFAGTKIGLIANNRMSQFAEQWLEENDIDAQVVYYDGFEEMDRDLLEGKIDLAPSTSERSSEDDRFTEVAFLGKEAYYLAVSAKREDLLDDLNDALTLMDSVDPYVMQTLQYKNFNSSFTRKTVTDEEKEWLAEHPVIRVGYTQNYLPYCATDDEGNATGIVTDVIEAAFDALQLDTVPELEYVPYTGYADIAAALAAGEIDYGFPVDSDQWRLEQDGLSASSDVISDRGALFYRDVKDKENIRRLAVNESNILMYDYTVSTFPDAEIVFYSSIKECLDAVLHGEVDGTIMDTLRVQYVTDQAAYERLSYVQMGQGTGKCYGVKHGNTEPLLLINRGLKLVGSSYGYDCTYRYVDQLSTYTTLDFLQDHALGIGLSISVVALAFILFLVHHLHRQRRELAEKEQLRAAAEHASAAKSTFLFNMSHDIRTPMNAVLGFNELMLQNLDKPEVLRDYIAKTRFSGEYLLGLINNVLEVARIDSGRETVNDGFADLGDESYYTVFETDIRRKHLNFSREADIEHRYVFADVQKIREILLNILSNAVKYTPDGGSIHVVLRERPCEKEGFAEYSCEISDTGVGMTEEFQKHIFDIFARERNTTSSGIMGTGLGMAIVKKLTDLMGGTVTVRSAPGEGSTFTVTMPLRIVDNPEEHLARIRQENDCDWRFDGRRVLLAEDNELNAEIATALLQNMGAQVDTAADGVQCIDMLQSHPAGHYDLILMDIQMPNLNGYDAARKIRALGDPIRAGIPIIAMTANAFDEDKRNALDAGMNAHVAKPIDIHLLARTCRSLLGDNPKPQTDKPDTTEE